MKSLMCCGALALALLSFAAAAQDKTLDPAKLTADAKGPPPQISDEQRAVIQSGLATENTEQKMPEKFEAKVGDTIPLSMEVDVMPESLVRQNPSLQPYGYAKLAKDLLVIDPTKKTIVAVIPRQTPGSGKEQAPADWAGTRGRELTGQAPEAASSNDKMPEPAGDSGDKSNGTEGSKQK